jgi:GNAT superfamily N-acetyltransferase
MMKVKLRKAVKEDVGEILRLIRELLTFEKLPVPDEKARKRLIEHGFSKEPKFKVLLAEVKEGKEKVTAGYAFYFYTYSTLLAKPTLYLEDIYVSEKYRNTGIGRLFFNELIKTAKRNK